LISIYVFCDKKEQSRIEGRGISLLYHPSISFHALPPGLACFLDRDKCDTREPTLLLGTYHCFLNLKEVVFAEDYFQLWDVKTPILQTGDNQQYRWASRFTFFIKCFVVSFHHHLLDHKTGGSFS